MYEKYQIWKISHNGKYILALWDFDRVQGQGHSWRPTM